ncbi:MAG TPA: Hsp20/alpha crystallin family protein [Treponemataceae bacterium]|nr:Hsp20/alpha crystallin family protein [Treponemataceae bacterium]
MNTVSLFSPSFTSDVIDAFDRGLGLFAPVSTKASLSPRVDVRETIDSYIMDMDLPGLTEDDVEINLKDRVLSISSIQKAEKEEEKKVEEVEYLVRERRSSCFTRRFTLPEDIDAENVDATFKNGVLTINIPRRPETKPRSIRITSSN